jgi:aminopeptidase N
MRKAKLLLIILSVCIVSIHAQKVAHPDIDKLSKPEMRNYIADPLILDYDVKFYHLDIAVSNVSEDIEGNVLIHAEILNPVDTFALQLKDYLSVDSVKVNGVITNFNHNNDLIYILSGSQISAGSQVDVIVYYHGTCAGGGLSSDNYWGYYPWTTWTLSESFHAKDWFPCKEDLTDKADSSYVFVTVDDSLMVGSNGVLDNVTTLGGGKVRYEWKSRHPIAYYLISIAVANYVEYNLYAHPTGLSDSILIQNYVYGLTPSWIQEMDETVGLVELFSDLYGMYPFADEKYGHCYAPLGGGMEHQTMTTMGYYDFWIIAHELGHMWWGDYVTCAHWRDIWVNEGFASYTEYLAFQFLRTQADADTWMSEAHDLADNQPDGVIYLPAAEATNEARIFDYELSYKKGASLVHMIRFQLNNDSLFFEFMQDFLSTYADSVATGADIRDFLYVKSGIDFTDFFDDWYYGYGYPTYDVFWIYDNDTLTMDVTQTTSSTMTTFFCNDMEYLIEFVNGGDTLVRVPVTQNNQTYEFNFSETVSNIVIDPNNWILNGIGSVVETIALPDQRFSFKIYPNPTSGLLNLEFYQQISGNIEILDITGKALYTGIIDDKFSVLDLSGLSRGVYTCRVISESGTINKRIIKD